MHAFSVNQARRWRSSRRDCEGRTAIFPDISFRSSNHLEWSGLVAAVASRVTVEGMWKRKISLPQTITVSGLTRFSCIIQVRLDHSRDINVTNALQLATSLFGSLFFKSETLSLKLNRDSVCLISPQTFCKSSNIFIASVELGNAGPIYVMTCAALQNISFVIVTCCPRSSLSSWLIHIATIHERSHQVDLMPHPRHHSASHLPLVPPQP